MMSFWERESFSRWDVVIVGAGIVGLTAALKARQRRPDASVLVLERSVIPLGASTRNAGFACFGSVTEMLYDIRNGSSADQVAALALRRRRGLDALLANLGPALAQKVFSPSGGYEIIATGQAFDEAGVELCNDILSPLFGGKVFEFKNNAEALGLKNVKKLIFNRHEGAVDSGLMMRSLFDMARERGITVLTGADVSSIESSNGAHTIRIGERMSFSTSSLFLATNAFSKKLLPGLPDLDITPGRGQVLITKPLGDLRLAGTFHLDEGFYYFRNVGNRLLFGGGRHKFPEQEATTELATTDNVIEAILEKIRKHLLVKVAPEDIDTKWAGIMCFGSKNHPIVTTTKAGVHMAIRCGGMGVALGSLLGEELWELSEK